MDRPMPASLVEILDALEDPRVDRTKLHNLTDILVLSVLAVICGADSFVAIALFGQLNEAWLRTFLALPHGIPSHDTLGRVLARLDASGFEEGFRDWVQEAFELTAGQVVPVDGKSVRGSHDRGRGLGPLHLVSAWAQANRLVLAQTAVDDKSNEITAIPELLRMLCLKGCIVTLDAMGCQKAIARQIRQQGADVVRPGQPGLGRVRTPLRRPVTTDVRTFISSLPPEARQQLHAVRSHWAIENAHHWVLDVAFGEDDSRIRTGYAAHNMAILKRIAHNLLRQDRTLKVGIANKRLAAGWDKNYLCQLIGLGPKPI